MGGIDASWVSRARMALAYKFSKRPRLCAFARNMQPDQVSHTRCVWVVK